MHNKDNKINCTEKAKLYFKNIKDARKSKFEFHIIGLEHRYHFLYQRDTKGVKSLNFTLLCQNNKTHKHKFTQQQKQNENKKERRYVVLMCKFGHVDVLQ